MTHSWLMISSAAAGVLWLVVCKVKQAGRELKEWENKRDNANDVLHSGPAPGTSGDN